MSELIDYTEVPCLQEILNFLPINPDDKEDVVNYIQNIQNVIVVKYKNDQYQFAYFGIHLLFMTYIYCTAWKISQIEPERYKDAIIFARAYSGRERDLDIEDVSSVFAYRLLPETEIIKLFKIIDLDVSHMNDVKETVKIRNDMAHASGNFIIKTEESFDLKATRVLNLMKAVDKRMYRPVRKWYEQVLLRFCRGEYEEYTDPKDIIYEKMILDFKLSVNELLVCEQMSVKYLINERRNDKDKLRAFEKAITDHCVNMGYI